MSKQVLIINITRMGDLVQMVPLLGRLQQEWPGVAIDVVVDRGFAHMANLLPGIRHVLAYDFHALIDNSRVYAKDVVSLYRDVKAWAKPLSAVGYDRIINLTFNKRSACLVGYVGAPDVRGITTAPDGSFVVKNPWMLYFLVLHCFRHVNRFNLVDIYALSGSGPGFHVPVSLPLNPSDKSWAGHLLKKAGSPDRWIAVQIGASEGIKAWRPEYFGQTMALLSRKANVGFVLIGTEKEAPSVREAVEAYRQAKGSAPICSTVGKTNLTQLLGVFSHCQLMLTNDTGPMHLAVSMRIPVINLSVGHVDFRETGPYGQGHWVVQPDIECGPCDFASVCTHHACKDRVIPEQLTKLCLHVLGLDSFPSGLTGIRVYEAGIDEDQLGTFHLRAGRKDPVHHWYGLFWRKYWYEQCTEKTSRIVSPSGNPPDFQHVQEMYHELIPKLKDLCMRAEEVARLSLASPLPARRLKACQERLSLAAHLARGIGSDSFAFNPITSVFFRETHNLSTTTIAGMAREYADACLTWKTRVADVGGRMGIQNQPIRRKVYACPA